mgnify:FL=1
MKMYVYSNCDFLSYINATTNSCILVFAAQGEILQLPETSNDYNKDAYDYIMRYVAEEDRKRMLKET